MPFNGLGLHLGNLPLLSRARSRSLSPENPTGGKGAGAMLEPAQGVAGHHAKELGRGWKVSPFVDVHPGSTITIADIEGPGAIQQIWMTPTGYYRFTILRIYWDDETEPSVECPLGDFFASAFTSFQTFRQISSLAVCVNPGNAYNCYWQMPFRKRCRITVSSLSTSLEGCRLFYQINYALTDVPEDTAYFHAQFRCVRPLPYGEVYTILDGVRGWGHYVGTYMAWSVKSAGWWGEGEIKFHLDGDGEFPTICGTGTEDYFCGSYNFENKETKQYQEFTTPYAGMPHVVKGDGVYNCQQRFSLYRWHIQDPVRFEKDLKVTIQALGWRQGGRYQPLQDDIASVAFWYQAEPHGKFPALPSREALEIL